MNTRLTRSPKEAAEIIKLGGIVAFPTETVYGLGADVFNEQAVAKIFNVKRRPADNPLIAHVGDVAQIELLASEITENVGKFIEAFFPGPLTVVLRKAAAVPLIATAGLETIGVRMPANDAAREFLVACGTPVVAPSANLSGRPSPTTWQAVYEDLGGRIDCILKGEQTRIGLESTVVDCTSDVPLVLRAGAVSIAELQRIVPETTEHTPVEGERSRSPGVRHKHYSPRARVLIIDSDEIPQPTGPAAFIGVTKPRERFVLELVCDSVEAYAHELFEFFRECDRMGIESIYCEKVDETGIGTALMDRIRRAAADAS